MFLLRFLFKSLFLTILAKVFGKFIPVLQRVLALVWR